MLDKIDNIHNIANFNDKELSDLASEMRNVIIEQVSRNGGHLASNLGLVELTISLFKNFNFDNDKIIFDDFPEEYRSCSRPGILQCRRDCRRRRLHRNVLPGMRRVCRSGRCLCEVSASR